MFSMQFFYFYSSYSSNSYSGINDIYVYIGFSENTRNELKSTNYKTNNIVTDNAVFIYYMYYIIKATRN